MKIRGKDMNIKGFLGAIASIALLSASGVVGAAAVYGPLTTATAYQNGPAGDNNDVAGDIDFGATDWVEIVKADNGATSATGLGGTTLNVVYTDMKNGTWSFTGTDPWSTYERIAIVLKDGKTTPPSDGIYWTAWLLADGTTSGSWTMPLKDISHMTVYGSLTAVPIPAAAWLFGSALIGLAGIARKRKTS